MSRMRSLIGQSPAIAIATAALVLSAAGGATAATVSNDVSANPVAWHSLKLINGWKYAGFGSFHVAYYLDASHVLHLRGSAHLGGVGKAVFRLPKSVRPSHEISMLTYASGGQLGGLNIAPTGLVTVFDQTGTESAVRDFTSFDGISYPLG